MAIHKIVRKKIGVSNQNNYVGTYGEIFLNDGIPDLRLSDGVTPGGISLSISAAGITTYSFLAGYASSSGISTVSKGLTGTPNLNVGVVTATLFYGNGVNLSGVITSLVGYATQGYVNNSLVGYATEGYVNNQGFVTSGIVVGYATEGYVNNSLVGYATEGYVNNSLVGYATEGYVNNQGFVTSGIVVGYATEGYVNNSIVGYATEGYVNNQGFVTSGIVVGYATEGYVNNQGFVTSGIVVGYATEGYVNNSLVGYATEGYVNNQGFVTSGIVVGYATEGYVNNSLVGFITSGALSGYATQGYVNNAISQISVFDQDLNTTDNVAFNRIGLTSFSSITGSEIGDLDINVVTLDPEYIPELTWNFGRGGNLTVPLGINFDFLNTELVGNISCQPDQIQIAVGVGKSVRIVSNDGEVWAFNADGGLIFPDNTVQTTAYTGVGLATEGYVNIQIGLATSGLASTTYVNNAIVGFITSGSLSGYATEGYVNTQIGLATFGLLSSNGNGSSLTGIVTSIAAGSGISINQNTGNVIISVIPGGDSGYASTAGVSTYATSSGIATYASTAGVSTYATSSGIATYADTSGIATYATTSGVSTYADTSGIATYATSSGIATYSSTAGVSTYATTSGIATSAGTATTATYLSDAANIITGTIDKDRIATTNSLTVVGDLYVSNNISFGGTTTQLNTQQLQIFDADIVLGIGTSFSPTDNTANHGGIAIASTEGTPLIDLNIVPEETNPSTYKKMMWFKGSTIGAGITDAWLFNYAVGIGSTQVPNGVRLAAGNIKITENDLSVVRGVNASGIVTGSSFSPSTGYYQSANGTNAFYVFDTSGDVSFQGKIVTNYIRSNTNLNPTITVSDLDLQFARNVTISGITTSTGGFVGNLTGTATTATTSGYATNSGIATYATTSGVSTYATNSGIATYATTSGVSTYADTAGLSTYANTSGVSTYADTAGLSTYATSSGIATYASTAGVSTYADTSGISTYATSSGIATYALTAGVSTYATSSGIATYSSTAGISTYATSSGIATYASTAGVSTYADTSGISTYASTAGIATVAQGLTGTPNLNVGVVTATSFFGDGSGLTGIVASGSGIVIQNEGSTVGTASTINFVGDSVTTTLSAGIATVTISGTGGSSTNLGLVVASTYNMLMP
jgi:hypothetical protein